MLIKAENEKLKDSKEEPNRFNCLDVGGEETLPGQ